MKTYQVEITETLQKVINVKASSSEDAINEVRALYKNEDIVLDYSDYMDTEFSIKN